MGFKRARSEQQREKRKEDIITAAAELLDDEGYEKVNFTSLSKKTGLTRPTLYHYFKTPEEIFLQLIIMDVRMWVQDLIGSFKLNTIYKTGDIAGIWTETLMRYPRFMELYSILFTQLEKNCTVETLAQFKREILNEQKGLAHLLMQLFPKAPLNQIGDFLILQISLFSGLYPMSFTSEDQKEAIILSETGYIPPDFKNMFSKGIFHLLSLLEKKG